MLVTGALKIFAALLLLATSAGCSFMHFELSPYAPRGLDVVYSAQEDITFFVWRVGPEVDFDRISFELAIDGDHQPIHLDDAPFPHQPFDCDRLYVCVQYQLPGKWTPPPDATAPLRSIDARHGTFESTPLRFHDITTSFDIDPATLNNNDSALPTLTDWFAEENIPLKRDFQWILISANNPPNPPCPQADADQWFRLTERISLPQGWTDGAPCLVVRPDRKDSSAAQVARRLTPSPVLFTERIAESLPIINHPTIIAFLADLQVINEGRCNHIISEIRSAIFEGLAEEGIPFEDLGVFRPVQGTVEDTGCEQNPSSRYPVAAIFDEARRVSAPFSDDATLLVVYLNNVELPPSQSRLESLDQALTLSDEEPDLSLFTWSIGSNLINAFWSWNITTPWIPIEDANFESNLQSTAIRSLPLRSTDVDPQWHHNLPTPNRSQTPVAFKICSMSPPILSLRIPGDADYWHGFDHPHDWPTHGEPLLFFDLHEQIFVPFHDYQRVDIFGIYEVCDAYCDHPFVGPDGTRYSSWLATAGVCQWK